MLKIKEFDSANELNKFVEDNKGSIKDNYSIEIFKLNNSYIGHSSGYNVVPRETLTFVLKYETIEY